MNAGPGSLESESASADGTAAFFAKYPQPREPMTPATLKAYFERIWAQAAYTIHSSVVAERLPLGGDLAFRLTFAPIDLRVHLRPALAHLLVPDGPAEAEVRISSSTSTGHVPPPWRVEDYGPRGEVLGLEDTPYRALYNSDSECLTFCDLQARRAIVWLRGRLPVYERAAPLMAVLPRLLAPTLETTEPRIMVHGGAVGTADGALLLAGRGGSGKSTTALAALCAGMDYLADDYCLLHVAPGGTTVRSLYASAKVDGAMLARLPQLRERGLVVEGRMDGEKHLLQLASRGGDQLAASRPLRALVLPRVEAGRGPHSATSRATPAEALRALAPSTVFQLGGAGAATTRELARLVARVPAFHLHLGTDVAAVPAVLRDLLGACPP